MEFADAVYHVTARGNERKAIYRDDADHQRSLETVEQAVDCLGVLVGPQPSRVKLAPPASRGAAIAFSCGRQPAEQVRHPNPSREAATAIRCNTDCCRRFAALCDSCYLSHGLRRGLVPFAATAAGCPSRLVPAGKRSTSFPSSRFGTHLPEAPRRRAAKS